MTEHRGKHEAPDQPPNDAIETAEVAAADPFEQVAGADAAMVTTADAAASNSARHGFAADLRDAVAPRTILLIVGVLALQIGFILSYVGAFHAPTPRDIPIAVVAPAQAGNPVVAGLNGIAGHPVDAELVADESLARQRILDGELSAALVVNTAGTQDTLLVATGGGASVVTAVQEVITQADTRQARTVTTTDLVPLQAGDGRGLTGFYLVIGWLVGGYLMAALLGVAKGSRPIMARRAVFRLVAAAIYAIVSGLTGALVVDQLLGAITGHFVALWLLGTLLVFAAAAVTMAFQALLGVIGIGLTVLIFVILGNPSAGGPYQSALLPPFWRAIGEALPNGAGTSAVREIVYFGANGIASHLVVIGCWALAGAVVALAGAALFHRKTLAVAG